MRGRFSFRAECRRMRLFTMFTIATLIFAGTDSAIAAPPAEHASVAPMVTHAPSVAIPPPTAAPTAMPTSKYGGTATVVTFSPGGPSNWSYGLSDLKHSTYKLVGPASNASPAVGATISTVTIVHGPETVVLHDAYVSSNSTTAGVTTLVMRYRLADYSNSSSH